MAMVWRRNERIEARPVSKRKSTNKCLSKSKSWKGPTNNGSTTEASPNTVIVVWDPMDRWWSANSHIARESGSTEVVWLTKPFLSIGSAMSARN